MRINSIVAGLIFLLAGIAWGQTAVKPTVIAGDVVSIGDNKIVIGAKSGQIEAVLTDKTVYKRVSAVNPSLQTATPAALSDISVGDKLTVSGILSPDGKSLPARSVYLMTKADISERHAKESEQWKTRGITGRVVAVDPQNNHIDVEQRSFTGSTKVTLTPKEKAKFLRYANDSIRYDEAKPSSLAEIKVGDMVRALGDRGADGTTFAAEEIVTGAFQTIAGTVKSVDPEKKEVVIKNLQTGKDMTILVGETSVFKKFPAEMAERMAAFQMGGVRAAGQGGGQARPPGGQGQTPGGGRGFGGGRGGSGIDDMLDRFPTITAADLKPGDMIALSSTKNGSTDRIKAIKLLAGVEPFVRMAQATTPGGQRGQGVSGGFTIPGLDGVAFP